MFATPFRSTSWAQSTDDFDAQANVRYDVYVNSRFEDVVFGSGSPRVIYGTAFGESVRDRHRWQYIGGGHLHDILVTHAALAQDFADGLYGRDPHGTELPIRGDTFPG